VAVFDNVISGNVDCGIAIQNGSDDNKVVGNIIGLRFDLMQSYRTNWMVW